MANHPPAINPFEPILLSRICWDFLVVSYSPSFVSSKIFQVDLQMSLHCAPSHKYSLSHRSCSVVSAAHNDEVNRLSLVVHLDLIWGRGCPGHSWTFSGTSCWHGFGCTFGTSLGSTFVVGSISGVGWKSVVTFGFVYSNECSIMSWKPTISNWIKTDNQGQLIR